MLNNRGNRFFLLREIGMVMIIGFCFFCMTGCGGEEDDRSNAIAVGSVSIEWSAACPEEISQISGLVYNSEDNLLTSGGTWACVEGSGLITGIPVGENYKLVLIGKNQNGGITYRGQKNEVDIEESNETSIDNIPLYTFVATLTVPENNADLERPFDLQWAYVNGAYRYNILISKEESFDIPLVDIDVNGPPHAPTGLEPNTTYYWKVLCVDIFGNVSVDPEIRQFQIREPIVTITSPSDGDEFRSNDNIVFIGEAQDKDGRALTGNSLVWESSVDGHITVGATFNVWDLDGENFTLGQHIVTLTATDLEGFSAIDTITINILPIE